MHNVTHRRIRAALVGFVAAAAGLAWADPASAQQRMTVLVPNFETAAQVRGNFGRDAADQVRRQIERAATHHAPVERNVLRDALRRVQMNEDQLDCITAMQLAVRSGFGLVLCGEFEPAPQGGMLVSARVIVPDTQDTFEIEQFVAENATQAAQHIVQQFDLFAQHARLAIVCQDYIDGQQWEAAIDACDRALEINPRSQTPLYARAFALMNLERHDEALAGFEQMLEIYPLHQDAVLAAGIVSAQLGRSDQAMRFFRQYLDGDPTNVAVRMAVANDVFRAGDPLSALLIVEEGLELADGEPDDLSLVEYAGHFALATAQQRQQGMPANGSPDEARRYFEKALGYFNRVYDVKGAETDVSTLRQMLAVYSALERNEDAIRFGERATQTHRDDAQLWSNFATALAAAGRMDDAFRALDEVERVDPEYRPLHARRGFWHLQAGRIADARGAFRTAIERGEVQNQDEIAANIAATGFNTHSRNNRFQQAIQYFDAAREFATSARTRGMINFFEGHARLQIGIQTQGPQTRASAQAALPIFQRAQQLMNDAAAYTDQAQNRASLLQAIQQYIEIQNALLRQRG